MRRALVLAALAALAPAARAASQDGATAPTTTANAPAPSPVTNKWTASLYGFAELDAISDTTQSFNDLAGNGAITKDPYKGGNGRLTMSPRNTRIGFKFAAPEYEGVKASGLIETDFFGAPNGLSGAPNGGSGTASPSEGGLFTSPGLRIRHAWVKLETAYVDVLAGQSWQLFGWQPYFHPNTVDLQGVPGQVYSRSPQLRLSHMFKSEPVSVELAVAAARPQERDAWLPDGQAGARVLFNGWKGVHTTGGTGTSVDALAIGASGVLRQFAVPTSTLVATAAPSAQTTASGWGLSLDAFIPIIPASAQDRSNALSLTGSWVRGAGIADMYTGLNGGLGSVNAVDAGLIGINPTTKTLDTVQWRSYIVGAQYYLPGGGNFWVSANYSQMDSFNIGNFVAANKQGTVFHQSRWADGNLFWDATPAVRFGAEYARFEQTFNDGSQAHNNRYQLSAYYLF
ncbi:MAG TPA: hypothetical protein VFE30_03675 [Anaeromyxobacteraceae bacterium]|jgi:hypothetical protein|nr:hypothetical protein [Anaeromyxobacteraceae bacterium]